MYLFCPELISHSATGSVCRFPSSLEAVLAFLVTWNTNSRNCHEAQAVVETLLKHEAPETLLQYSGIKPAVESLLPYTGESCCRSCEPRDSSWCEHSLFALV